MEQGAGLVSDVAQPGTSAGGPARSQQDLRVAGQVAPPEAAVWQQCVGKTWGPKSVPTNVSFTKGTLKDLFGWQHGSDKDFVPTVIFRYPPAGSSGGTQATLEVRLNPPSRDDKACHEQRQASEKKAVKVDGYPVPAQATSKLYAALGAQRGPGKLTFESAGWDGNKLVMSVAFTPAAPVAAAAPAVTSATPQAATAAAAPESAIPVVAATTAAIPAAAPEASATAAAAAEHATPHVAPSTESGRAADGGVPAGAPAAVCTPPSAQPHHRTVSRSQQLPSRLATFRRGSAERQQPQQAAPQPQPASQAADRKSVV